MLLSQSRLVSGCTWILALLATLIWLPRLLGTEPDSAKTSPRPSVVVLDVTELPEAESAPESTPKQKAQTTPTSEVAPTESTELRLLGPLEADITTEVAVTTPEPVVPLLPLPQGAASQSVAGPAVRYWIVSTRCCPQKSHRCGVACRFMCHLVTEDCQIHAVHYEEMLASMMPGTPACVFVHGSFTRWQDVWRDAECSYRWLRGPCPNAPLNFIYFTWPSEGVLALASNNALTSPIPVVDFAVLGRRAEHNGFYLADLVGSLPPQCPVSLIGHSYGARTIASGLHLLGGGSVQKQTRWNQADCGNRIRVVMAAAAIDHDWFNPDERYGCALNRTECLLSLRNECDLALALYPLRKPFSGRSLARTGFTRRDQRDLGERACQVSELDVTSLIGKGHGWPHYVRRPEIAASIAPFVYFEYANAEAENAQWSR